MKQLEITTNKRLLIVEYETEAELAVDFALMKAFKNPKVMKFGLTLKPICKGSDLAEDIAKGFVEYKQSKYYDRKYYWDYKNKRYSISESSIKSFISAIQSKNYHWGENPVKRPIKDDSECAKWHIKAFEKKQNEWQESESRAFNPSKCIIFEIL